MTKRGKIVRKEINKKGEKGRDYQICKTQLGLTTCCWSAVPAPCVVEQLSVSEQGLEDPGSDPHLAAEADQVILSHSQTFSLTYFKGVWCRNKGRQENDVSCLSPTIETGGE